METVPRAAARRWTLVVLAASAPLILALAITLWRTPLPVLEAVSLLEDVSRCCATDFLVPATSYYRPAYHLTLSAIWHSELPLAARLTGIKLMHIVPLTVLIVSFIAWLRPRSALDAAAAMTAVAVLIGSPGLADNLEIPLSYTIVGMALAMLMWALINQPHRIWHTPVIVVLTLLAIGFKEQGLVVVPVILVAWWTRAPGVSRTLAATVTVVAVVYVVVRLRWRDEWPMFQQAIGYGFSTIEPPEALARFGQFPYGIFTYNGISTMLNVLFAEPTGGVFSAVRGVVRDATSTAELINLASSTALTGVIGWWGTTRLRAATRTGEWSVDTRLVLTLVVSLLACGALSFDYSRSRLGGMAVVFYALAAYAAVRAAAEAVVQNRRGFLAGVLALGLLAASWQIRSLATLEHVRALAEGNQAQWVLALPGRQSDLADRPVYQTLLQELRPQGLAPGAPRPGDYPAWFAHLLGLP